METEKLIERLRQERASLELAFPGVNAIVFDVAAAALTTMQDREATLIRALERIANMPATGLYGSFRKPAVAIAVEALGTSGLDQIEEAPE